MQQRKTSATPRMLGLDRRRLIAAVGGFIATPSIGAAWAEDGGVSGQYQKVRREIAAGREIRIGRVALDIPRLAESGNSVALRVTVASPMTEADHVRAIHILSEKNPVALIARFQFGPRSGRAEAQTNIRLATTQLVHALAETSDGGLWEASTEVVVLLAACLDGS